MFRLAFPAVELTTSLSLGRVSQYFLAYVILVYVIFTLLYGEKLTKFIWRLIPSSIDTRNSSNWEREQYSPCVTKTNYETCVVARISILI